jgi:DNA-binding MarR family transcriptional regulator
MLNRVVTNLYDEALRPLGLKASRWEFLSSLPNRDGPARRRLRHPGTRRLDAEPQRGSHGGPWLVEIVPGDDRREQPFRLTATGRALLRRAAPRWEKAQEEATALLGKDGVLALNEIERHLDK